MSTEARAKVADLVKFDILTQTQAVDNEKQIRAIARSFILPTKEMQEYAAKASLGDDVYHEPSTIALEAHMAKLTGKEAALFMPSGTMSNQIALRTHLRQPPYSIVCDHRAHINKEWIYPECYIWTGHHLTLDDIKEHIVTGDNVHFAPTEIIELENTLNGTIIPQEEVVRISDHAHSLGIKMHLDGARIWHVAAETGVPLSELCAPFDSVSLCFSKGLAAPIGSCLVGPKQFIAKARWFRKLFGGGMRQTGVLTASAAYALTYNFPKLFTVHALARRLEQGLKGIGAEILSPAETCMVFYDPTPLGVTYDEIFERGSKLPEPLELGGSRLVVHVQTTEQAVEDLLTLLRALAEEKKAAGFVPPKREPQVNGQVKNIYIRRN
ncbi:hypothetical protein EWM64_g5055 [Hericium alpestre]|uniref:Aromatic amino acid beta-eliminating lyase/threonine aldolase domain-containing protein n=1 Tax=Hericium alpestre TaxID=135208 RepID=A0A4Y9ZWJ9_9AGAM|nr:hypothetical protein EWM64_g5055 [Hericium alpestre]